MFSIFIIFSVRESFWKSYKLKRYDLSKLLSQNHFFCWITHRKLLLIIHFSQIFYSKEKIWLIFVKITVKFWKIILKIDLTNFLDHWKVLYFIPFGYYYNLTNWELLRKFMRLLRFMLNIKSEREIFTNHMDARSFDWLNLYASPAAS